MPEITLAHLGWLFQVLAPLNATSKFKINIEFGEGGLQIKITDQNFKELEDIKKLIIWVDPFGQLDAVYKDIVYVVSPYKDDSGYRPKDFARKFNANLFELAESEKLKQDFFDFLRQSILDIAWIKLDTKAIQNELALSIHPCNITLSDLINTLNLVGIKGSCNVNWQLLSPCNYVFKISITSKISTASDETLFLTPQGVFNDKGDLKLHLLNSLEELLEVLLGD